MISALACIVNRDNQSATKMEVTEEDEMKGNLWCNNKPVLNISICNIPGEYSQSRGVAIGGPPFCKHFFRPNKQQQLAKTAW